jgi:hypothetical protein
LNARSQLPIVEGARTSSNSRWLPPARSRSVSSIESPPARIDPITVNALVPLFAASLAKRTRVSTSPARFTRAASAATGNNPALGTRHASSNLTATRVRS